MGEELLGEIAEATGLPKDAVSKELVRLLTNAGRDPAEATLEDLRHVLAEYVQDVLVEAKEALGEGPNPATIVP